MGCCPIKIACWAKIAVLRPNTLEKDLSDVACRVVMIGVRISDDWPHHCVLVLSMTGLDWFSWTVSSLLLQILSCVGKLAGFWWQVSGWYGPGSCCLDAAKGLLRLNTIWSAVLPGCQGWPEAKSQLNTKWHSAWASRHAALRAGDQADRSLYGAFLDLLFISMAVWSCW